MTTYSKSDLATRILRDAGLIGSEEVPSAADLEFVEETLSAEIDLLAAKGLTIWNGSDQSVPRSFLTTLSRRIVMAIGPSFGLADAAAVSQAMPIVERDLRIISQTPKTGVVLETDYY